MPKHIEMVMWRVIAHEMNVNHGIVDEWDDCREEGKN